MLILGEDNGRFLQVRGVQRCDVPDDLQPDLARKVVLHIVTGMPMRRAVPRFCSTRPLLRTQRLSSLPLICHCNV